MTVSNTTKRPNFLIIVADDLGFTDLSAFGGEIHAPNLKKLAENGARLTDFHTASACSPTRSMLLSGTDNHIAGVGQMAEFAKDFPELFAGKPGYEGVLNSRVAALPEILQDAGYYTFISGKWHLGLTPENWPVKRGFEKSFTLLPGAGIHYKYKFDAELGFMPPLYAEDDRLIKLSDLPDDFYSTTHFTDRALEFIESSERNDRPFFGCLTYTAPHWPYQAPADRVAKYKGMYDNGPRELRAARLAAATKAGVIPPGVEPHPVVTQRDKAWADLSLEEQQTEARIMETYAAMVEILDENVGRVVDRLEALGELENTFILFMSDNGAEGFMMEALPLKFTHINSFIEKHFDNSFANIGRANSFVWYSDQWAQAATAPSYMHKMWASEGGIRCPLIVHYPPLFQSRTPGVEPRGGGTVSDGFTTVMDITPTVLDLAGVPHPGTSFRGRSVVKPRGQTWVPYLAGEADRVHSENTVTGWELFGQQAIRKGYFKALFVPEPFGLGEWQLFDLKKDPGEVHDLATTEPVLLEEMLVHWADYVAETGLVEFGDNFNVQNSFYNATTIE